MEIQIGELVMYSLVLKFNIIWVENRKMGFDVFLILCLRKFFS